MGAFSENKRVVKNFMSKNLADVKPVKRVLLTKFSHYILSEKFQVSIYIIGGPKRGFDFLSLIFFGSGMEHGKSNKFEEGLQKLP